MESEGPYTLKQYTRGNFEHRVFFLGEMFGVLRGQDVDVIEIVKKMNVAHTEGRKVAEKDFKELLGLSQRLCDDIDADIADEFRDWKKARGLE